MNSIGTFGNGKAHLTLALMTAMGLSLAAHTSYADDAAPQRVVRYADLNTNTPDGVKVLYRRIKSAAAQVCESANSADIHVVTAIKVCEDRAIRAAVAAVKSPLLTREYASANHLAPASIEVASLP
jgi:UrcA family protein